MKLTCEHTINNFSKDNKPVMTVTAPSRLTIETKEMSIDEANMRIAYMAMLWSM